VSQSHPACNPPITQSINLHNKWQKSIMIFVINLCRWLTLTIYCLLLQALNQLNHNSTSSTSLKSIEPQLYFNGQLTVKDPHLYSYLCQKFYLIIMLSFICRWHIEQQVKYRCLKWTKYRTTDPTYCENYNLWIDSVTKTFSGMLVL